MDRRDFLKKGLLVTAGTLAGGTLARRMFAANEGGVQPANAGWNDEGGRTAMTGRGMLNVCDFGAKGDGKADDTRSIQEALNEAGKAQGTVFVPNGDFLCHDLKVPVGAGIQGLPTWSYRNYRGSVLRLNDSNARCLLDLTGAYGATVYGLSLHGGRLGRAVHGILVEKPDYGSQEDTPRIDACCVGHFTGDGIRLERIWCFSVRHSYSHSNGGCGLRVRGWDGFILDNWFSGNHTAGFGAYDENASNTLTANRIEWNRAGGIVLRGGKGYNITGNYIDRSGHCGIELLPAAGSEWGGCMVTVTGNVIYRSGKPEWGKDPDVLANKEASSLRAPGDYDSAHARFEGVRGLVFSGNAMNAGRDDGGKGGWSPDYSIVVRKLENSIIKDNVMHEGSLKDLLVDRGEHGANVIIKDNVGSLMKV